MTLTAKSLLAQGVALAVVIAALGCQSNGGRTAPSQTMGSQTTVSQSSGGSHSANLPPAIRRVSCFYPRQPFLNLDMEGDRDPEGIQYRAYLDTGTLPSVLRDGEFHIEMYTLTRLPDETKRELVSDWHYSTSEITTIRPKKGNIFGPGYLLSLRWAAKDLPGQDIEIVTRFVDEYGREARAETKSFKVPKYSR